MILVRVVTDFASVHTDSVLSLLRCLSPLPASPTLSLAPTLPPAPTLPLAATLRSSAASGTSAPAAIFRYVKIGQKTSEATYNRERVEMHALYHRGQWTAMDIGEELGYHESSLSKIVKEPMTPHKKEKKTNRSRHKILSKKDIHTLVDIAIQDLWH